MKELRKNIYKGIKRCKCCNSTFFAQGFNPSDRIAIIMKRKGICYDCAYWQNLINYPPPNMEVVGTKCIRLLPMVEKKDKSMFLGSNGKYRYFVRNGLVLVQSNDVWTIGTIPSTFRQQLPPTLIEVTQKTYHKLKNNGKQCMARGCFDRYHCLRYKLELEHDRIGKFNEVPSDWKIGDEHCKYFIDKFEMTNDDSSDDK